MSKRQIELGPKYQPAYSGIFTKQGNLKGENSGGGEYFMATVKEVTPLIITIIILFFILAIFIILTGGYLTFQGQTADTELEFFGQSMKSSNIGIAAIFIGAVMMVLLTTRALKTFDRTLEAETSVKNGGASGGNLAPDHQSTARDAQSTFTSARPMRDLAPKSDGKELPHRSTKLKEWEHWKQIRNGNNPKVFEEFVEKYPTGKYADRARAKLGQS
jgi:hypothetical protein